MPPLSKENIEADINLLKKSKQRELFELFYKHTKLFSGKIPAVKVGEHKICLLPGTKRKKPHIYKIPESLKPEVDKQIKELELLLNILRPI